MLKNNETKTKIKVADRELSRKWKTFKYVTTALVPVSLVLGIYSGYNVYSFLASRQTDFVSLSLWSLIFVLCLLHLANAVIFRCLNNHYWKREREFNTIQIVSRTLASAADSEKQASAIQKKQELVNEVSRKVATETKAQIEESVKKGFDGVKGYFAESLRRNAYTQEADNAVSTEPEQEAYTPPEKQAPSPAQEEKKIPQQEEVPDEEDSGDDEVPLNPSSDSGSSDDEDSQVEQEDVPDETDDGLFYDDEVDDESKW